MTDVPFVQARNYTPTGGRAIDLIVVHDMEAPETPSTAENVASWFAGPSAPRASAHYCIDNDSAVQCVRDEDVAWHAPGANHSGLGFEHAGYANQTEADWSDGYSEAMLRISAELVAERCASYGIPIDFVDAGGILAGARGITTHAEVTKAYPNLGSHTDPGPGFPMGHYLDLIRAAQSGAPMPTPHAPAPAPDGSTTGARTLRVGSRGADVAALQVLVKAAGHDPGPIDGIFGEATKAAVEAFQAQIGVAVDGVVGPETQRRTGEVLAYIAGTTAPAPDAAPPFRGRVISYPPVVTGDDVRDWQGRMAARGWAIAVDGAFGPASRSVAIAFQQEKGLAVDGIVGPETWSAAWTAPIS